METKERISALLQHYDLSINEFVERAGIRTRQAIYDIYRGKTRNISESMACKILSCFPDVDRVWLLTGEGEMLKESNQPISSIGENGDTITIPGKVWKVIEQQADSLAARDKQIDDLIAILKESQKRDADDAHQEGNATSAVVG